MQPLGKERTQMKKFQLIFILISIILCLMQCKLEEIPSSNIILYDKPLNTIKCNIQGKWELIYAKGGYCGSCISYCDHCTVEFTSDNKFISNTFALTTDTTSIHWVRDLGTYTNGLETYLMTFHDIHGVPWGYVIERIINDTLIYHDNTSDAMFYHFIRLD